MKLAIGSARRDATDLKWFRRHAPSMPLGELKSRLQSGQPIFEWSPETEPCEYDDEAPFRRIERILEDAKQNGIRLTCYEIDYAEDISQMPAGWEDEPLSEQHTRNLIESMRQIRSQQQD